MSNVELTSPPEMPTQWRIWTRAAAWVTVCIWLGISMTAVLLTANPHIDISPESAFARGIIVAAVLGILVVFYNSRNNWERKELASGCANRSTLQYLAKHPSTLLIQRNLTQLWEEAVRRIPEQEARGREKDASVAQVRALGVATPDNLKDLRGETLRKALCSISAALDAFGDEDQLIPAKGFNHMYFLYGQVVEAIARQLAEDAGLVWASIPRLAEGTRPKKLEVFMKEFGVYMDVGGMYVGAHREVPSALRRAIAYVLTDAK